MSRYIHGYDARAILRIGFETAPRGVGTATAPVVLPPPRIARLYPLDPAVRADANAERAATLGATRDDRRPRCRCCGRPTRGWWRDFKLCRRCGWAGKAVAS